MSINIKLSVTEIQRFCMHDGPGIRTTVFFKGCPLKCAWCHNPETQKSEAELLLYPTKCIFCRVCEISCLAKAHKLDENHVLNRDKCKKCFECVKNCPTGALEKCGKEMTINEIISAVKKDWAFYGESGGITVSGGEPFMQGESVIELLKECKAQGISTAVETSGYADVTLLKKATEFTDLFLWDVKDTNEERHKKYTGVSNKLILKNLDIVNKTGARIRLRCILVNGVNTDQAHYSALVKIAKSIKNFDGLEFITYHAYGGTKSVFIGLQDSGNVSWIPTEEQVLQAKEFLKNNNVEVI